VFQWQIARGALVLSQPFSRAASATLRGKVLQSSPAQTGRVRQVEHESAIKCGLKGPRSPGSVPDRSLRRPIIKGVLGTLVSLKGKPRIAPLHRWLHDRARLRSALSSFDQVPCFARISVLQIGASSQLQVSQRTPNYALQRSWTHKLLGARTARKSRTRLAACAVTGRRAAAEL